MRVRALKAAPDTAGLYLLMKGFALHPFEEGERGNSPTNCNLKNHSSFRRIYFTVFSGVFFSNSTSGSKLLKVPPSDPAQPMSH